MQSIEKGMTMANPYDVERSWPDYFLEHRRLTVEKQGTYGCEGLPVWTVHCPLGYLGNSTIIEGDDGLIVYDTGVNAEDEESTAIHAAGLVIRDLPMLLSNFRSEQSLDAYLS